LALADIDPAFGRFAHGLPLIFVLDEDIARHKVDRHSYLTGLSVTELVFSERA